MLQIIMSLLVAATTLLGQASVSTASPELRTQAISLATTAITYAQEQIGAITSGNGGGTDSGGGGQAGVPANNVPAGTGTGATNNDRVDLGESAVTVPASPVVAETSANAEPQQEAPACSMSGYETAVISRGDTSEADNFLKMNGIATTSLWGHVSGYQANLELFYDWRNKNITIAGTDGKQFKNIQPLSGTTTFTVVVRDNSSGLSTQCSATVEMPQPVCLQSSVMIIGSTGLLCRYQ